MNVQAYVYMALPNNDDVIFLIEVAATRVKFVLQSS